MTKNLKQKLVSLFFSDIPDITPPDSITKSEVKSWGEKFNRNYVETDGLYELFGRYQVERYLDYNGKNFVHWFDPLSFLYITKAINNFDVSRNYDSLEDSLSRINSDIFLISFKSDLLFLPREMKKIYDILKGLNKPHKVRYIEVDSNYGHDAFLVDVNKFGDYIIDILEGKI